MDPNAAEPPRLFTVGHSNQPLDAFIALLIKHEIQVVVDSRSSPYSKYVPQFNRREIEDALKHAGLKYLYMGQELGGRPDGDDFYDDDGRVLYYRVAESPTFLKGIERLEQGIRRYRVALMCSEENPAVCHRHLLVGRVMDKRGTKMLHIREDGKLDEDSALQATSYEMPWLFELPKEDVTWKSLRSVSRKKTPSSSSDSSADTASDDWSMSD